MPIPIITGSPGVYIREEDISQQDIPTTTSIAALTFGSRKGTLAPVLKTSPTGFSKEFGPSDLSWSFAHIEALAYFSTQNNNNTSPPALWCQRVVNTDARHAGATVLNLGTGAVGNSGGEILSYINPLPKGTLNGFDGGGQQLFLITLSGALQTADSVSGVISYNSGTTENYGPVVYATSGAATLTALAAAINTAIAGVPPATNGALGSAQLVLGDATRNQILIYGPEGTTIDSITAVLTTTHGTTTAVTRPNNIIDIYAENPGAWADDIGVNISSIDTGVFQRIQLNFSAALITANTVNLAFQVNSNIVTVPTVTFATSNDATLAALATAIQTAITNSVATVIVPTGSGGTNARQITIIAPNAGPGVLNLLSGTVSNGASQATVTSAEVLAGSSAKGTFALNVWQRGNIINPAESYTVSLTEQLDGQGRQLFIVERVNVASGRSQNIRVRINTAAIASGAGIDPAFATQLAPIIWLNGGNDGSLPTNSQIITGWNVFEDNETYRVNLLINGGYTDLSVMQFISSLAGNRQDCMAILDMPSDVQDVDNALNFRTTEMNIDTSYAAVYSPDVEIKDLTTDRLVFVPPSGYVASRYVYTDNNFATWWAPAGVVRGALPNVEGLAQIYKKPDRDVLDRVQINCLRLAKDGSGFVIWGDNTTQVTPSLLSAVNVRRLMLYVENTIASSLERNVFDNNSAQLAFLVQQRLNKFLAIVQNGEGISKFLVLANASNNPAYFADAGQFNVSVYVVPIRAAKTILLDAIVTPSDISFNELIINGIF